MGCRCGNKAKKAAEVPASAAAKTAEIVQSRPAPKKSDDPRTIIIGMRYNAGK